MSNFDTGAISSPGRGLESESELRYYDPALLHPAQPEQHYDPTLLPLGDYGLEHHAYRDGSLEYFQDDATTRATSNADWSFLNNPLQFLMSPADINARFERATQPLFDPDLRVFESGLDRVMAQATVQQSLSYPRVVVGGSTMAYMVTEGQEIHPINEYKNLNGEDILSDDRYLGEILHGQAILPFYMKDHGMELTRFIFLGYIHRQGHEDKEAVRFYLDPESADDLTHLVAFDGFVRYTKSRLYRRIVQATATIDPTPSTSSTSQAVTLAPSTSSVPVPGPPSPWETAPLPTITAALQAAMASIPAASSSASKHRRLRHYKFRDPLVLNNILAPEPSESPKSKMSRKKEETGPKAPKKSGKRGGNSGASGSGANKATEA